MAKYGRIKVANISLTDEMFKKVCDILKLITDHYYQDRKVFYIYGIDNDKIQYNIDRGADTKQSLCFLDSVKFRINKNFPQNVRSGLSVTHHEK